MTKEKKQNDTNVEQPKQEIKYPQIGSELRAAFSIYTKLRGVFKWEAPYQAKLEDSSELLATLKLAIDKTIAERIEAAKKEAENAPNKTKEYTPVK